MYLHIYFIISYTCSNVKLNICKIIYKITLKPIQNLSLEIIMRLKSIDAPVFLSQCLVGHQELWYVAITKYHQT